MAVVTKRCDRCGDQLVIETAVQGGSKLVLIEMYPAALTDPSGVEFDISDGASVAMLYGLIAVPVEATARAWVVTQYTELHELVGHKLHRVHVCSEDLAKRVFGAAASEPPSDVVQRVDRTNELLAGVA